MVVEFVGEFVFVVFFVVFVVWFEDFWVVDWCVLGFLEFGEFVDFGFIDICVVYVGGSVCVWWNDEYVVYVE